MDWAKGTHIEPGLRGVSDLEMVHLSKALRVKLDELVPGELPAWEKDLRPPTARADGEQAVRQPVEGFRGICRHAQVQITGNFVEGPVEGGIDHQGGF